MPVPILQRQRALAAIGEVRIGAQKTNPRAPGRKLDTFRLTSQQKELIETAAELYGGEVGEWQSPVGPSWQVITERADLPIMVVVGYSLTLMYELWSGASKCERRCDGETEMLSDQPCICNAEGGPDKCDIITRFMMLLPELGTSLGWRFRSTGEFAANELAGGVQIANELAKGRVFVPATLRLTQRRTNTGGQVHRFAVPVLDFDPRFELGPRRPALPPVDGEIPNGYTPIENRPDTGVGVKEGLEAANRQELQQTARSAEPISDTEWEGEEEVVSAPGVPEEQVGPTMPTESSEPVTAQASGSETEGAGSARTEPAPVSEPTGTGATAPLKEVASPSVAPPVPTPPEPAEPEYITEAERRKFHAHRRKHVVLDAQAKEIIREVTGQESTSKIPKHLFQKVLDAITAADPDAGEQGRLA